jgi:hypothetical protein
MEDFSKTFPNASERRLERFKAEYEQTLRGDFVNVSESNYELSRDHVYEDEKMEDRLYKLRYRAKVFAFTDGKVNPEKLRRLDEAMEIKVG